LQDYADYDVVICDDSSSNEVEEFIKGLDQKEKIKYVRNEQKLGSSLNTNRCIVNATGNYVKLMHHDDYFSHKGALSAFVAAIESNPDAKAAFSDSLVQDERSGDIRRHSINEERFSEIKKNPLLLMLGNSIGAPSACIFRKPIAASFDPAFIWLMDIDFYISLLKESDLWIHIPLPLITTTHGAVHQVTAGCLRNPRVELKEYSLLFQKHRPMIANQKTFLRFFARLLHSYKIYDLASLKYFAPSVQEDDPFFEGAISRASLLRFRIRLKGFARTAAIKAGAKSVYSCIRGFKQMSWFRRQLRHFSHSARLTTSRFEFNKKDLYPCLDDNTKGTGFDRHYVYHLAWATRVVRMIAPDEHTDISSFIYFPAMLSAFVRTNFYDYRPAEILLDGLQSGKADLFKLPFADNSIFSLSCMHTVEHVGLGRYGDPIDYDGDLKAIAELKRVTASGGNLLFVVPVGKPRIQFNAHRIYSYDQVMSYFNGFSLREFALIPDNEEQGGLIRNADPRLSDSQEYACGCFWLIKNGGR
jgi:glycosyltransferase involved in cell wall biosynthesis